MLPDLDSYWISILRRTYLATFSVVLSVLYQILCLTFFSLKLLFFRFGVILLPVFYAHVCKNKQCL